MSHEAEIANTVLLWHAWGGVPRGTLSVAAQQPVSYRPEFGGTPQSVSQRSKPRLYRASGCWYARQGPIHGAGATPLEAYWRLVELVSHQPGRNIPTVQSGVACS